MKQFELKLKKAEDPKREYRLNSQKTWPGKLLVYLSKPQSPGFKFRTCSQMVFPQAIEKVKLVLEAELPG